MNWTTKGVAALVAGTALFCGMGTVTAVALTGHHGTAPAAAAAPARTATPPAAVTPPAPKTTVPAPTKTIYVTPPAPLPPRPMAPAAPVQPQFTNSVAVVSQYYQDITDHNYAAAWALGGKYIGGQDYSSWVAGYSTTASVSLYSFSDWGSGKVTTYLSALQSDGTTRTYYGTYYVSNGVITSASIAQTS
jgi:hypothetical protein